MSNVKCWNCGMDFEHVSSSQASAAGTSNPSATHIEELLLANMFDGERGGMVTMKVDALIKEVAELLSTNKDINELSENEDIAYWQGYNNAMIDMSSDAENND